MLKRRRFWFVASALMLILIVACVFAYAEAYNCEIKKDQWQTYCTWAKKFAVAVDWFFEREPDFWVALFTFTLFVSTTGLWFVTYRLWDDARNQRRDNRRAIFANLQAARAARRSADLARDEFIASHRPQFAIHSIRQIEEETRTGVQFVIINAGTSEATVLSSEAHVAYTDLIDAPWRDSPSARAEFIERRTFAAGASETLAVMGPTGSIDLPLQAIMGPNKLYFYGWILYVDVRSNQRTTYFCRVQQDDGRFAPIADPEANQTY